MMLVGEGLISPDLFREDDISFRTTSLNIVDNLGKFGKVLWGFNLFSAAALDI